MLEHIDTTNKKYAIIRLLSETDAQIGDKIIIECAMEEKTNLIAATSITVKTNI